MSLTYYRIHFWHSMITISSFLLTQLFALALAYSTQQIYVVIIYYKKDVVERFLTKDQ